ncbi:MAG TPA: VOC family protein [Methylomirabilota bacterium]|nr:VOC family protein [Methylomirabilota bacterium]
MALRHLALKSRDLEATKRFYTDLLGLREAFVHRGMLFLETPRGGDLLNFVEVRRRVDPEAGGLDHFGLHVPRRRFRGLVERLRRAGVRIVGRRGRWSVYVKDPNGYTVEVYAD